MMAGQVPSRWSMFLSGLLAAAVLAAGCVSAQAAPVLGQGTWEAKLKGRDANGNEVPLLVSGAPNPALKFVYDTDLNLTWLADWNVKIGRAHV